MVQVDDAGRPKRPYCGEADANLIPLKMLPVAKGGDAHRGLLHDISGTLWIAQPPGGDSRSLVDVGRFS